MSNLYALLGETGATASRYSVFMAMMKCASSNGLSQLLGTIVDLFGNVLHELRSTKDGVVITIRHVPRVQAGDALVNIAQGAGPPEY